MYCIGIGQLLNFYHYNIHIEVEIILFGIEKKI